MTMPPLQPAPRTRRFPAPRGLVAALAFGFALVAFVVTDLSGPPLSIPGAHAKTDRAGTYELGRARMLSRVVGHIRAHYVDPARVVPREMLRAGMKRVEAEIPEIRVDVKGAGPRAGSGALATGLVVSVLDAKREFGIEKVKDLYELNWKFMEILAFVERAMPPRADLETIEYAAIAGMLSTLDPHSAMLSPRQWREMQLSQRGRFGGLGVVVGVVEGALVVQAVMEGTPASEGGLVEGDRIVQIDDAATLNMSLDEAVSLLRGEPGSEVTLWIARDGSDESRQVLLRRREITLSSVTAESLGEGIGWVHVRTFQDNTDEDLIAAVEKLEALPGGLKGLVLDLRDNPGGLLDKAIAVSDLFIERGTLVATVRESGRERDESHATQRDTRANLSLVVLVNRGSASASEIVAGALKQNDRALIVGQRTFGKGSVQVVYRIDDAALKLTVAQYLTPGDVSIQGVGVVPDVAIAPLRVPSGPSFFGLDLLPVPDDAGGEASLSAHLDSTRTRNEKPAATLRILDEGRNPSHRRGPGGVFVPDASVAFARDLLTKAPSPSRRGLIAGLGGFLVERAKATGEALGRALSGFGVSWEAGGTPGKLQADLTATLRPVGGGGGGGGGDGTPLVAGRDAQLTVRVKNRGALPLYRVHAETDASTGVLRGLEVAFGKLEPGESAERSVKFKIPEAWPSSGDHVQVQLYADGVPLELRAAVDVATVAAPAPRFAHAVQVRDAGGAEAGANGDGLVQRGERFGVEVWIDNLGPGTADDVTASLRNLAGTEVVLHAGRVELGAMKPGERKRALFELTVRPSFRSRFVDLQLEIDDGRGRSHHEGARTSLALPVFPDGLPARTREEALAVVERNEVRIHAGAHRDSEVIGTAAPSVIMDVVGRAGGWLEVAVSDQTVAQKGIRRTGWVAESEVRLASEGAPVIRGVTWLSRNEPPELRLDDSRVFADAGTFTLRGDVRFAGGGDERRLVYVFRGRDKVFSKVFAAGEAEDAGSASPFEVEMTLEAGRNDLVVIAREGEGRVSRRELTVFRR
jgi:carboxyl-terminal processing protease